MYTSESSETTLINGYECYQIGNEYFTSIDGKNYHVLIPIEESVVTDPVVLAQLDGLFENGNKSNNTNSRSYPTSTWPNARDYDLSTEGAYIENVNLANGDYYSPGFTVDILDGFSAASMMVDFVEFLWFDTVYIQTTFYYCNNGKWTSARYEVAISEMFNYHIFSVGTGCRSMTKMCLKMHQQGSKTGVFRYKLVQSSK